MDEPTRSVIARTGRGTGSQSDTEEPADWSAVQDALRSGSGTSWLSVRDGVHGVHTRPVFAAWGGSSFYFASKASAVKTRHLRHDPVVSLAIDLTVFHVVVEGVAEHRTATRDLERASAALLAAFEWPTTVVGAELDAPYAAPTSGGPPFQAWELRPRRIHVFPTEDQVAPTRFDFEDREPSASP